MFKKIILAIVTICLFYTSIAAAEKQEWVDKDYDFTKVKRVVIINPGISNHLKNGIIENEIAEVFKGKAKLSNVKVIDIPQVVLLIKADTGIDLNEVFKENQVEAMTLLRDRMANYADIVVTSNIGDYSMGSTYREPRTYTTTDTATSHVYGPPGTGQIATIETPVTETHRVPGKNISVAQAHVRFDVYDTKTAKTIFSRIDNRDVANPTIFNNTKPKSVFGRIVGGFFDDLNEKINKK